MSFPAVLLFSLTRTIITASQAYPQVMEIKRNLDISGTNFQKAIGIKRGMAIMVWYLCGIV